MRPRPSALLLGDTLARLRQGRTLPREHRSTLQVGGPISWGVRADVRFVLVAPWPAVVILVVAGLPARWSAMPAVGLAMLLGGLVLLTMARWQLGDAFSVAPRATTLVTRGLYARVRNPVYVFGLVMFAGLILYFRLPWLLLGLVPVAAMQTVRARREAKVLEDRFGEEYRAYRARTWL